MGMAVVFRQWSLMILCFGAVALARAIGGKDV
jgi:hypothetical protein